MQLIVSCCHRIFNAAPVISHSLRDLSISLSQSSIIIVRARWRRNQANPRCGSPDADNNSYGQTDAVACGLHGVRYMAVNTVTISNKCYSPAASQPAGRQFRLLPRRCSCSWSDDFAGRRDTHSYLMRTVIHAYTHDAMRCIMAGSRSQWALMENIFFSARGF